MKLLQPLWIVLAAVFLISCQTTRYRITEISGTIVQINSSFDAYADPEMVTFVDYYKSQLDEQMGVVIGIAAQMMDRGRPESLLTNFTADVMKKYGDEILPDGADLAVMNVNGHRAAMPKGAITMGDLFEIYSFDNTIVFLDLKGSDLRKLFEANIRGFGISSNVRFIIENDEIRSITIDGKPIDNEHIYKVVTLDYLADGNDGMGALENATSKYDTGIILRDIIIDYIQEQTRQGNEINSQLDGRIVVLN
ncbi:MAG: 5'-nucleotidase C-terminal domain-containing protein [Dysgonamonadaceae bacterium]|nr:5'-nucleotidase C-terminal domain-containing protein [Dysgonamonadaceae bacterium]